MSTPIERAAEALESLMSRATSIRDVHGGSIGTLGAPTLDELARAALEAAIDEGEIARVIASSLDGPSDYEAWSLDYRNEINRTAAAIKAHLLGGDE